MAVRYSATKPRNLDPRGHWTWTRSTGLDLDSVIHMDLKLESVQYTLNKLM